MNINPFVLSPAIPDELFCDRQKESASLMKSIINQENVVLISPRRVGKTGLIYHCFNQSDIHDNYVTVSIDILHTTSFQEFLKELGTAVFNTIAKRSEYLTKLFVTTLRSLSGSFGLDPVTFMPTFDIKLGQITMPEYTLDEIFTYLEKADKPCIVAIDEFQQITKYQERNIEALLRGRIQKLVNTHFIFAGSERRMMNEMFFSNKRPFFQSATLLQLEPIDLTVYTDFAVQQFKTANKNIEPEAIEEQLLQQNAKRLQELLAYVTEQQKELLYAIAADRYVQRITSSDFVKRHHLKSASAVQSAVKRLLDLELITEQHKSFSISDPLLRIWINR